MYSKIKKSSYLFIFVIIALLSSCGEQNIEEKIVGTWQVESATVLNLDEMVKVHKEMIGEEKLSGISDKEIKQEIINDFTADIKGSEILFSEDKKITIEGFQGNWEMIDSKTIIAKNGDNEFNFIVKRINENKLKFELVIKEKEANIRLEINCKKK